MTWISSIVILSESWYFEFGARRIVLFLILFFPSDKRSRISIV